MSIYIIILCKSEIPPPLREQRISAIIAIYFQKESLTNMRSYAILKQVERCHNYIAPQVCYAQFYIVNSGALMPAGNCVAESAFLF